MSFSGNSCVVKMHVPSDVTLVNKLTCTTICFVIKERGNHVDV